MVGYGVLAIAILASAVVFGTLGFTIAMVSATSKNVDNNTTVENN